MWRLALVGLMLGGSAWAQADAKCEALASLKLNGAIITSATLVPAGAAMAGVDLKAKALPALCRVRVQDKPSAESITLAEIWLPATGWNGKLHGVGNGGFAGSIYFDQMAANLMRGDVVSGTDAGHEGMDASFALGHPERVKDFGWRAIHDTAVISKTLVQAFYGKAAGHSYFTACSDGGREALMEAQRFPGDYDGILAGAPAYNWSALVSSSAQDEHVLRASAATNIPPAKLPAIGAAVRAACDALDGVKDGVLNDPRACHFQPQTLLCKNGDQADCLTSEQVTSLQEIYTGKLDASGTQVFPGYLPGAEDAEGGWNGWLLGDPAALPFFANGYFKDFVYGDPAWQLSSFDFASAYHAASQKTAADLNATDANLNPFLARGGKLILYHGWNDPAIPALSSVAFYDRVRAALGASAMDAAMRLYMVPGMLHCDGGPGATDIGQDETQPRRDAEHDVVTALQKWVETGKAPATIVASGNGMTRPICVWPELAKYNGGDTKLAASYKCVR